MAVPSIKPITNAMSVDVEDYFQVSAFERHIERSQWEQLPRRVEANTERVLDLFAEKGVSATFFMLGWVAERHRGLIRRIIEAGHELASHGSSHKRATQQRPEEFKTDVADAKALLEDLGGREVLGYRAPSYSIGASNLWAFEILGEVGYRYSSSVYPIRHDIYGMPEAPRFAFRPEQGKGLLEIPVTTLELGGRTWPCGGGGYFRLTPYSLFRWGLRRVNEHDGRAAIFYFHPWEIDPGQPRPHGIGFKTRFRHYLNLDQMEGRLRRLLGDFRWGRVDHVYLGTGV